MKRLKWKQVLDAEDQQACIGLTNEGFGQRQIAAILGCTQRAVMACQHNAGIHNAARRPVTPFVDLPVEEIERRCLEIQLDWDDVTREQRRVTKGTEWTPPVVGGRAVRGV